jgi:hypothetical protein
LKAAKIWNFSALGDLARWRAVAFNQGISACWELACLEAINRVRPQSCMVPALLYSGYAINSCL